MKLMQKFEFLGSSSRSGCRSEGGPPGRLWNESIEEFSRSGLDSRRPRPTRRLRGSGIGGSDVRVGDDVLLGQREARIKINFPPLLGTVCLEGDVHAETSCRVETLNITRQSTHTTQTIAYIRINRQNQDGKNSTLWPKCGTRFKCMLLQKVFVRRYCTAPAPRRPA